VIPSFVGRVSRRRNPPDANPCGAIRFALRLCSGQAFCALRRLRFDNRKVLLEMDAVMEVIAKQIPPNPPFSKWGANQSALDGAVFEQKTPAPFTPTEIKTDAPVPPFEKGGLGGICVDSTLHGEKEA